MPRLILDALMEADLPDIAQYYRTTPEALMPMLAASRACLHEGRYYEAFAVRCEGCLVGVVSLFEQPDGTVCDGVDVFPAFRRRGYASHALQLLTEVARARGFTVQTAQIRTDNAASIALHGKLGFTPVDTWINRRGHEVRTWRKELV